MLLAERTHPNPTILVPPWPFLDDPPTDSDSLPDSPLDFYSSDEFRMFDFKVRRCPRGRSHDWTECPFAHPGEKARRRDPRKFNYSGAPCPEFRKGSCKKGESCEFAHGVFECWLHPAKYRTQPCKDGTACRRRVCFFAHTADQLRIVSPTRVLEGFSKRGLNLVSSPKSTLASPMSPTSDYSSPPVSPSALAVWFGRLGIGRSPAPPRAAAVDWDAIREEGENEEAPDFGWVSELVK